MAGSMEAMFLQDPLCKGGISVHIKVIHQLH